MAKLVERAKGAAPYCAIFINVDGLKMNRYACGRRWLLRGCSSGYEHEEAINFGGYYPNK